MTADDLLPQPRRSARREPHRIAVLALDGVSAMDLGVPVWPFFLVSWIGDVSAVLLIAIRTYRLIFHPEDIHDAKIKTAE